MHRLLSLGIAAAVLLASTKHQASEVNAADKPQGFGAQTKGGAGGRVITVTNLADQGAGSLRAALTAKEPRRIVFAVEGAIVLKRPINVNHGRVTVDGSTAPGKGITITDYGIWFLGKSYDIILRHLRIRATKGGASGDGLLFNGDNERILIDHCSVMWCTDENIDTWGRVKDLTCQWTIIAEGQQYGDHPKGRHSMGWLCGRGCDRITIHHCLFAHNGDRNPLISGGVFDLVNNVIYNWSGGSNATKLSFGARANVVNNIYIPGAESGGGGVIWLGAGEPASKVYVAGNVTPFAPTGTEDPRASVQAGRTFPAPLEFIAKKRFDAPAVGTQTAREAYRLVLERAGPKVRDADEIRVIQQVREKTGHVGRRNEAVDERDRLTQKR